MAILDIIQRDEIEYARIGNHWCRIFCVQRDLESLSTFRQLLRDYNAPRIKPPFHRAARLAAGFQEDGLKILEEFAATLAAHRT